MNLHNPPASVLDQGRETSHKFQHLGHPGLAAKAEYAVPIDPTVYDDSGAVVSKAAEAVPEEPESPLMVSGAVTKTAKGGRKGKGK